MFGFMKLNTKIEAVKADLVRHTMFSSAHHEHKRLPIPIGTRRGAYSSLAMSYSIDEVVEILWNERKQFDTIVMQLQSDLAAIHAHYRDFLCGDCCHQDVCRIKDIVKYGYECEDKACPELADIEIDLLGEELRQLRPEVKEDTE